MLLAAPIPCAFGFSKRIERLRGGVRDCSEGYALVFSWECVALASGAGLGPLSMRV